ncbi:MAG: iron chelate uptake ABC transporter family permease subunit [Armatimonadetes bacterium]|nr:iron chelate uptake ABC transporter family permease subunit [Armatimonadota bacterium]
MIHTRVPVRKDLTERIRRPPALLVLPLLLLVLILALAVASAHGSVSILPATAIRIILNGLGLARFPATWDPREEAILLTLRLPRVAGAALVGAALATAGALFQGLLRNPLADPYVVGTSGGAALGAVLGMMVGAQVTVLGFGIVPLAAFVGALAAMALVVGLAGVGGRLPAVTVLLAGFAVSSLLGYTVSLLLVLNDRLQLQMPRVYGWLLGGIAVTGWSELAVVGPLAVLTILATLGLARSLNALSLGEDGAARLGIAVERDKRLILVAGSLLTAAAVSISGLIGFVGLIVPHVTRLLCGPDHRLLLPATALAGASFLVLADLLARALLPPTELPVGIVTAFLGGPFFLWLLRHSRREYR